MTFHEHQHDPRQRGGRRGSGPRWARGRWGSGSEERPSAEQRAEIKAWFTGRLPDDFYLGVPEVTVDNEEILVIGALSVVELDEGATAEAATTAEEARIERFREDTREHRIRIAEEAQGRFGRVVSWGATVGGTTRLFTTANVPVMTRLRMSQRQVLDTLIDAGIRAAAVRRSPGASSWSGGTKPLGSTSSAPHSPESKRSGPRARNSSRAEDS